MADQERVTSKRFGKYKLIAHLATGGMAEIYLASQSGIGGFEKLMVVKRILPNLSKESRFVQMFLDEARIAAKLSHPNVVQIYEVDRVDEQFYIAMEYLSGESLASLVVATRRRGLNLAPEIAAGIVMQAAEGLRHAHDAKGSDGVPLRIVHRDISPQNIFVLYDGGVKVVDFGIAKAVVSSFKTRTGVIKGKLSYMSPEQVLNRDLDARSDIFSLGVVLWECLTGRKLFSQRDGEMALFKTILEQDAPSPRDYNPEVPEALCRIASRALARNREKRYQTAGSLRSDLGAFLKSYSGEGDMAAIGKWMRMVFFEHEENKRRLIDDALAADRDLGDYLFNDLSRYVSDTEISMEDEEPVLSSERPALPGERRSGRGSRALLIGALVLIGLLGATWLVFLFQEETRGDLAPAPPPARVDTDPAPSEPVAVREPAPAPAPGPAEPGLDTGKPDRDASHEPPARKRRKRPDTRISGSGPAGVRGRAGDAVQKPEAIHGLLDVACLPWCEILVDGKPIGKRSPLQGYSLPVGEHLVEVVNPPSQKRQSCKVRITKGERSQLRFRL
ncbi:MAG: serine/threonine protein kinase [Deltaproteobacteria bacterium]|nr:serine/threonine protein kinase [Deltaproteobacteria bacterium]